MNKYDENYSAYFQAPSAEYPEGAAVNATDADSFDGTPFYNKFFNDVIGFMYAAFHGVFGNPKVPGETVTRQISNQPDNAVHSDVWDAIKKFVTDKVAVVGNAFSAHASNTNNPHEVTKGQVGLGNVDNTADNAKRVAYAAVAGTAEEAQEVAWGNVIGRPKFSEVAFSGDYQDLSNTPNIPATPVNADWDAAEGLAEILHKPTIPVVDTALSETSTNAIQNKVATLNMNGVLCSTAAGTQIKEIPASAMPGFVLYAGATIKVLFQNACTVSYPQLKVGNTAAKKIMAYRGGSPVDNNGLKASSGKWRGASTAFDEVWQPYTTLELMYDGTNWVVMGDPVIENYFGTDFGYEKKANGLIIQWGEGQYVTSSGRYTLTMLASFTSASTYKVFVLPNFTVGSVETTYFTHFGATNIDGLNFQFERSVREGDRWLAIGY